MVRVELDTGWFIAKVCSFSFVHSFSVPSHSHNTLTTTFRDFRISMTIYDLQSSLGLDAGLAGTASAMFSRPPPSKAKKGGKR